LSDSIPLVVEIRLRTSGWSSRNGTNSSHELRHNLDQGRVLDPPAFLEGIELDLGRLRRLASVDDLNWAATCFQSRRWV
jgi:hypothetical protein